MVTGNKWFTHMFELSLPTCKSEKLFKKIHGFCRLPMFGKIAPPTNLTQNSLREDEQH